MHVYRIIYVEYFKKQLRQLSKKDRYVENNLWDVLSFFNKEHAIALGRHTYKIRLRGLGKGKSGGYRAYLLLVEIKNILAPLYIYAKNEKQNLSADELNEHVKKVTEELEPFLLS